MIKILTPIQKQVFQRSNENKASVLFSGTNTNPSEKISITATEVGKTAKVVDTSVTGANWSISQHLAGGYYELTLTSPTDSKTLRFGVGEVFACTGHSFAEGIGSAYVTEERAIIQSNINGATVNPSDFTDEPVYKSIKDYALTDTAYSKVTGVWGQMAENLVNALNVPVMLYHSSWGGTSLKQWSESAQGLNVTGFAGYNSTMDGKGYPYAKLKNILKTLVPKTGLRGVLIMHGENDSNSTQADIENYYKTLIQISRTDANIPNLPYYVSLSTWHPETEPQVLTAQRNTIANVSNVFLGADITTIGAEGRIKPTEPNQDLHLNPTGDKKASELWANAIIKNIQKKQEPVTLVIKQGQTVVNNDTQTSPNNSVLYGFAVIMGLLLFRIFGAKIPIWLMLVLGVMTGGAIYLNESFPKKI